MRNILKSKVYLLFFLITSTLVIGTGGYMLIEEFDFLEAFYMTVITISTTGFGEVHPLTDGGRIFTILLLIFTLGVFAYSIGSISSYLLDGDFMVLLRKRRIRKQAKKMENHVIICGYGRNGRKASEMFTLHKTPFIVIERKHELCMELREKNIPVFEESALEDEVLLSAGILNARALMCALPDDTDNLYVVLSAREMNPKLHIISRASNDSVEKKLKIAGATEVIKPDFLGGMHMAYLIINPDVKEFIDFVTHDAENMFHEIDLELYTKLWEKPIRELRKHNALDISIVGLKNNTGGYTVNPPEDTLMTRHQQLIVLATTQQLEAFKHNFA
jgi:voltage-gated potassium channel